MPFGLGSSQTSSSRRSRTRLRENRNQIALAASSSNPKPKSRSPDSRALDEQSQMSTELYASSSGRRRKRGQNSALSLSNAADERPHAKAKLKSKATHASLDDAESVASWSGRATPSVRTKRKERSKSRDVVHRVSKKISSSDFDESEKQVYTGPLAHADYNRMKEELEEVKKVSWLPFSVAQFLMNWLAFSNCPYRRRRYTSRVRYVSPMSSLGSRIQ